MESNNVKDHVISNNGVKMPILAFGTYLIPKARYETSRIGCP